MTDQKKPDAPAAADALEAPASASPPAEAPQAPRYWAWTDRWDPGTWEMPDNPTRLQKVLAGIALVIILVMTIWLPLRILKLL